MLQHYDSNPLDFILEESAVNYPFVYDPDSLPGTDCVLADPLSEGHVGLARMADPVLEAGRPGGNHRPAAAPESPYQLETFQYQRRDEPGVQTPGETLQKNSGSCRDFATLLLETCRCWGLAARFVSGYMQCEATEAGGASTHAWTEVYLPGAGWKGFDPTSGILTGAQHVTVAVARNPENAAPIGGLLLGLAFAFRGIHVDVKVEHLDRPDPSCT